MTCILHGDSTSKTSSLGLFWYCIHCIHCAADLLLNILEFKKYLSNQSPTDLSFILKGRTHNVFLFVLENTDTDTHQFLNPTSPHPYHCKKGIPYSQALRLNRI